MRTLLWILFGIKRNPAQYYGNPGKLWIHKLSREQLMRVFSHEDLLYRLSEGQIAALGERALILQGQNRK